MGQVRESSGVIGRIWRRLRGTRQSPGRVALAAALGLFIGCLPVYGLHFVLCCLVCLPLGLDLLLSYLLANVSNPLVAPFLVTLEVEVGSLLTTGHGAAFSLAQARRTGIWGFVWQAGVGSVCVGFGLAVLGGTAAYAIARQRERPLLDGVHAPEGAEAIEAAMARTIERYRRAPLADRVYVATKLRWDPLTRLLAALPGDYGRLLDAGCGRGQFGLFLAELGRCERVRGFDGDPRKVAAAVVAGGSTAFEQHDLLAFPPQELDTLLLADVLHYLPPSEQDRALERAAECVPHGRILIRELDAGPAARSRLTRSFEWLAKVAGYNRGRAGRHYRPASEIVTRMASAGFTCEVLCASAGTPFANVLIVATRA